MGTRTRRCNTQAPHPLARLMIFANKFGAFFLIILVSNVMTYRALIARQIVRNDCFIRENSGDDNLKGSTLHGFRTPSNQPSTQPLTQQRKDVPLYLEDRLADLSEPYRKGKDVPFYWHVHKSGGTTMQNFLSECFGLVEANHRGGLNNHEADKELQIVEMFGNKYVNVDTSNPQGIARAKKLGLTPSGLADVIFSPYFHEGSSLFSKEHQGRMFAVLRHPILRAESLFSYLAVATWEEQYRPDFANMTIEEYASDPMAQNNFMTRFLVNKPEGQLMQEDVEVAKEILRKKCLIGLIDNMDESLNRFTRYFGWLAMGNATQQHECKQNYFHENTNTHDVVQPGSGGWKALMKNNEKDLQVFSYAEELFEEQKGLYVDFDE
mmetsp:Transcript_42145/g.61808  ORF Transcript_42145/g.61808 Transcript_42145/m.61808 type:complete len:380 (+) Transcript_42145:85-1224(+)